MATPYALDIRELTDSTQDDARSAFAGRPVLVVAGAQRRGRGRRGRAWQNAPRSLATSLAWRPSWPLATWSRIPLVAGLAAHTALIDLGGKAAKGLGLKWPNDVVLPQGKLAGLLVEAGEDGVVAGLGVNLWWPEPPQGFAGLLAADPGTDLGLEIAEVWATDLLTKTEGHPDSWGRSDYESVCTTLGQNVTWQPDGRGRARAIAADGALLVETAEGTVRLDSAEVWEVRTED